MLLCCLLFLASLLLCTSKVLPAQVTVFLLKMFSDHVVDQKSFQKVVTVFQIREGSQVKNLGSLAS